MRLYVCYLFVFSSSLMLHIPRVHFGFRFPRIVHSRTYKFRYNLLSIEQVGRMMTDRLTKAPIDC